ncbi:MAG TPA: AraC family transcriptional regulator [Rubricoccaceae bacterium]|nr:AraC family transcriptional regulator [Rubricoccaceae bacterium]
MPARLLHAGIDYVAGVYDYAPGRTMRPHAHAGTSLSVVLAGRVWERVGRADETGGPLSVVVKPAGAVHENRFGPEGARMLAFEFAPGFFDGMEDAPTRWRWRHGDAAARRALRLCRAAASDPGSSPGQALDDALALLLAPSEDAPPAAGAPPRWLRDVRDRLHDEAVRPPPAAALADEAGVHRVTLARAFRRHFGCSVTAYLRRLRVRAAAAALAATDAPLAAVALDAGFADQPHLTRAFRAAMGTTPGAFRAALRA